MTLVAFATTKVTCLAIAQLQPWTWPPVSPFSRPFPWPRPSYQVLPLSAQFGPSGLSHHQNPTSPDENCPSDFGGFLKVQQILAKRSFLKVVSQGLKKFWPRGGLPGMASQRSPWTTTWMSVQMTLITMITKSWIWCSQWQWWLISAPKDGYELWCKWW